MAGRRCPGSDERDGRTVTCPIILTNGERYCPRHQQVYEQRRGTPRTRGYGAEHRALRAMWQRRIDAGEVVTCADGCGAKITGTAWDLGHTADRTGYVGPQLQSHNRADGGRRAHL